MGVKMCYCWANCGIKKPRVQGTLHTSERTHTVHNRAQCVKREAPYSTNHPNHWRPTDSNLAPNETGQNGSIFQWPGKPPKMSRVFPWHRLSLCLLERRAERESGPCFERATLPSRDGPTASLLACWYFNHIPSCFISP